MKVRALISTVENAPVQAWIKWRIINPYEQLVLHGVDAKHMWSNAAELPTIEEDVEILVLPRVLVNKDRQEEVRMWLDKVKSQGTKVVCEADDDIWSPSYVEQLSRLYIKSDSPMEFSLSVLNALHQNTQDALWMLNQCDAVTVSTRNLMDYVNTLTKGQPVYLVPNAIDVDKHLAGLPDKDVPSTLDKLIGTKGDRVTVGWAGGQRASADLEQMVEGWIRVANARHNVVFVVAGWAPPQIMENKWLKDRVIHLPWQDSMHYAANMQVDIGCVSVAKQPFCERKSPIKAWEFALSGATIVASKALYGYEPIFAVCETPDDWYLHIMNYVDNASARKEIGDMYRQHVYGYHDLSYEFYCWLDAYDNIRKGRVEPVEELHAVEGIGV